MTDRIDRAIAAGADTSPDLPEVSRTIIEHGDRFQIVGIPPGDSFGDICDSTLTTDHLFNIIVRTFSINCECAPPGGDIALNQAT